LQAKVLEIASKSVRNWKQVLEIASKSVRN
jgi:ribosomal protein S17E